ncbi:MAG: flagellar basal body-associated FliL family protein [Methylococcaceae bacterium]
MHAFSRNLALSLLLLGLSGSISANEGGGGGEETGVSYLPLEPITVNLEGRRHYLKVDVQVLMDSKANAEKVKIHIPAIRHMLIMMLSNRNAEEIATIEERESIRKQASESTEKLLEEWDLDKGYEDVFFTDFLIQ